MTDVPDIEAAHDILAGTRELLLPDDPQFEVRTRTGGSENRLGESEGHTDSWNDLNAVVWSDEESGEMRGGAQDDPADLRLDVDDGALESGDVVRVKSTRKTYRVFDIERPGGSFEIGEIARLREQEQ